MAAVTQLVPNLLGGVSRQTDDKKLDGQVVDIVNGYPDPTYGMVKRASTAYLWTMNQPDGTPFNEGDLADAFWFYAESRTEVTNENNAQYPFRQVGDVFTHPYIACIKNAEVYVWDSLTGTPQTVINTGRDYLTRPDNTYYGYGDFHARTILNTVIICNRKVKTEMIKNNTTFTKGLVGTVRINSVVPETEYTIIIDGTNYTYTSETQTSAEEILNGIEDVIPAQFTHKRYKTSVEIKSNTPFTLDNRDSSNNSLLNTYQDTCLTPDLLASPSEVGRLVEIIGDKGSSSDNYYLEFTEGSSWTETINPTVDFDPNASTLPHRLYINEEGNWEFGRVDYTHRLVGDDENNPIPSFIGERINSSFFYNNRLGFLSGANVIMSQAKDVYNFFGISQLTVSDADPIDINANSTRPTELYEVVVQQQGILLFGTRQQFWLNAPDTGVLTPSTALIKAISSYESEINISPLDIGTTIGFVSKSPDYSKLMVMEGQGDQIDPTVVEISKVVTGWLPNTITSMAVSPQNSFVALTGNEDKNMYIYRFYNDGSEDKMQAWTKWEMPGTIQTLSIMNDTVFSVTLQGGRYCTSWVSINSLDKSGPQFSDDTFKPGGPFLDFLSSPSTTQYYKASNTTRFYTKFPLIPGREGMMVLTLPVDNSRSGAASQVELIERMSPMPRTTDDDPGYYKECNQGTDGVGSYFEVNGDFRDYRNSVSIGYSYNYEVVLPKFYYKLPAKSGASDYTAHLNINRVKFAVGLTGAITFKLKAKGSDEWVDIQHVTDADYYEADTDPLETEQLFTVPVHQRNKNFQLKVTSDLPFPVSLVSMMWEGQYTPRFYRRS